MRLGEIKNIIGKTLNDKNQIVFEIETIFSGQAYLIKNYVEVINALKILVDQDWNEIEPAPIRTLLEAEEQKNPVQITSQEYNKLNSYISALNSKLPLYFSILETMVDKQDEKTINIKLPDKIKSLKDLESFNKRIEVIFKRFNLAGKFELKGFDKGTSWYEILITGELLYRYFLACLAVAIGIVHLKKTFYEAENAKLAYKAAIKEEKKSEEDFLEEIVEIKLDDELKRIITEIGDRNGKTMPELKSQLISATKDLVKELGEGTEFHLSFNPPAYAKEELGNLMIDYSKMPKAEIETKEKPKQLDEAKKEKTETDGSKEDG